MGGKVDASPYRPRAFPVRGPEHKSPSLAETPLLKTDAVLIVRLGQPQHLAHETISREEARALKKAGTGYFTDSGRVIHLIGELAQADIEEIISYAAHELSSNASLSQSDMLANVGLAKRERSTLTAGAVKRAQAKVKAWMSEDTQDKKNPLVRGNWVNLSTIEVTATA